MDLLRILAILIACTAYSLCCLPLWEGFDEPFHYAYVTELSRWHRLPDQRKSTLSQEVWQSLQLAPVSHIAQRNLPQSTTFAEFQEFPTEKQQELRRRLETLDPALGASPTPNPNYEAHQPPLAYLLLAIPDWFLPTTPLLTRIAILRGWASCLGTALLAWGVVRVAAKGLQLPPEWIRAAAFPIFTCQMTLAALSHVSNDYLAIPLVIVLAGELCAYTTSPSRKRALIATLILAAGLLTKAYFLALLLPTLWILRAHWLPTASTVAILAGPWYARNAVVYGSISGTPEAAASPFGAILNVPWADSMGYFLHAMLWTGNSSFVSFSQRTLELFLALLLIGIVFSKVRLTSPVPLLLGFFAAALGYATLQSFVYTRGSSLGASPWYGTPLVILLILFAFRGFANVGGGGRWLALSAILLALHILLATFWFKLPYPALALLTGKSTSGIALFACEVAFIAALDACRGIRSPAPTTASPASDLPPRILPRTSTVS